MSFHGDDSRRYGHVPLAQYAVANQSHDQALQAVRRSSFYVGDETSFQGQNDVGFAAFGQMGAHVARTEAGYVMNKPPDGSRSNCGNQSTAAAGYQHQYQRQTPPMPSHATYNPQTFTRSQSTSVPLHAGCGYGSPTSPTYRPTSPTYFVATAYNPAAYANTNPSVPQRQATNASQHNSTYGYGSTHAAAYAASSPPAVGPSSYSPSYSSPQYVAGSVSATSSAWFETTSPSGCGGQYYRPYPLNGTNLAPCPDPSAELPTPYPTDSTMPVGPAYEADSFGGRAAWPDSHASQPSSDGHQQSRAALQRHPTDAPLPRRPIDGDGDAIREQDELMYELLLDLGGAGKAGRLRPINGKAANEGSDRPQRYKSTVGSRREGHGCFSAETSTASRKDGQTTVVDDNGEESDPEGAAGVMAMLEDDRNDQRFSGSTYTQYTEQAPHLGQRADSGRRLATLRHQGTDSGPFHKASVDYGGTGGLQPPQRHGVSFDEGELHVSLARRQGGSESALKDDLPEISYHCGLSNRPLPALPAQTGKAGLAAGTQQHSHLVAELSGSSSQAPGRTTSLSTPSNTPHVQAPVRSRTDAEERRKQPRQAVESAPPESLAAYETITLPSGRKKKFVASRLSGSDVKRCAEPWALSSVVAWIREMTEDEQYLTKKIVEEGIVNLFSAKVPTMNTADAEVLGASVVESMVKAGILMPDEEWVKFGSGTMSGVLWQLTGSGCYGPKLHENERQAPRMHGNGHVVKCYASHCNRTLKKANLDGLVLEVKEHVTDWATFWGYSIEPGGPNPIPPDKARKEVERQNILHEIVTGEVDYMEQLDTLRLLYRDQLRQWKPPIIAANRLNKFMEIVFGKVDVVQQINKEHLLAQLKYRQQEEGPWISGFSDLFREWIRKARPIYVEYGAAYPHAEYMMRQEAKRNLLFRQFLDLVRADQRSKRLDWTTFLRAPMARLQRYSLLLETVHKASLTDNEEKHKLVRAIEEIKAVTFECDAKVDEMNKKVDLLDLQAKLTLRPGMQVQLNLTHLGRELLKQGELQRQGNKGFGWVDASVFLFDHYLVIAKAIVPKDGRKDKTYDVSKEPIPMPMLFLESRNDEAVSKHKGIAAVARPTVAVAPTTSTATLNKVVSNAVNARPGIDSAPTGSSIMSLNTVTRLAPSGSSTETLYPFKVKHLGVDAYTLYASSAQERVSWCNALVEAKTRHARALHVQNAEPFRLRVLADTSFTYDSLTASTQKAGVAISGTPLDRAIRETELGHGPDRGPVVCRAQVNCSCAFDAHGNRMVAIGADNGVYVTEAGNARAWTKSVHALRVTQIAVLEDFALCLLISNKELVSYPLDMVAPLPDWLPPASDKTRRTPQKLARDVAFFATARMKDRTLVFYKRKEGLHTTFKVVEPVYKRASEKRGRVPGGRLHGGTAESFRDFDEFYLPTECYSLNLFHTSIAVATARGFELLTLDRKITQSIPSDLTLPAIANMASRIQNQRPLGMFRLNDAEFLLAYEDCAVFVDKHGDVSRALTMEYSGKMKKVKGATMFGQYLILFTDDYVEVRNAESGRLRQIIAGRDVRVLDFGFRGPTGQGSGQHLPGHLSASADGNGTYGRPLPGTAGLESKGTVKIAMSHPEIQGGQIVLEMLLNDGHVDN